MKEDKKYAALGKACQTCATSYCKNMFFEKP